MTVNYDTTELARQNFVILWHYDSTLTTMNNQLMMSILRHYSASGVRDECEQ